MYDALESGVADCVQPLLLYPQSNLVQCAGTFGPYFKEHLFDGNKADADIVKEMVRQALTSALYAMKRSTFEELGGFDEFYYNKLEAFSCHIKYTYLVKLVGIFQALKHGILAVEDAAYIHLISHNKKHIFGVDMVIR